MSRYINTHCHDEYSNITIKDYRSLEAIRFFIKVVESGRADTYKEMFNFSSIMRK